MVACNNPSISMFFLTYPGLKTDVERDSQKFRTDLYYKVQNLLRSCSQYEDFPELTVPQFSAHFDFDLRWTDGFPLCQDLFIENAKEKGMVKFSVRDPSHGVLNTRPLRTLDEDFIFGVCDLNLPPEMPLFVSLVTPDDWIKA